jgi:hypothetical protein
MLLAGIRALLRFFLGFLRLLERVEEQTHAGVLI